MGDALRAQEYLSASRTAAFVSFQLGRREILLLTLGPAGMVCLVESRNRSVPGYAPVFRPGGPGLNNHKFGCPTFATVSSSISRDGKGGHSRYAREPFFPILGNTPPI